LYITLNPQENFDPNFLLADLRVVKKTQNFYVFFCGALLFFVFLITFCHVLRKSIQ